MRKDGYFWIKVYQNSDWQIANYCTEDIKGEIKKVFKIHNGYISPANSYYEEKNIFEICENEIEMNIGD